ncbi:MAG: site-specific DNA-methyltransferase [Ruminococcus sp.]|nr:site-specific DNA-methyltransferase [Ruminococcus sp.]
MSKKRDDFIKLMKGIFELDKSDLDFGIYRIMNIRKAEIESFLSDGINEKIEKILAPFAKNDTDDIKKQIAEIEKQAGDFGITDISSSPMAEKYNNLKAQLAGGVDLAELESDVYSHLFNFFNRYYDEGDFISKRRYKEGVYAIPYEGEEVKLYWANQDQYYIKTSENFKDYTFIVDGYSIHFRIVDATTEQNNNKESDDKKRKFMLYTENEELPEIKTFEFNDEKKEFIIRFIYDIPEDKKVKYEELNYATIKEYVFKNSLPFWQALLAPIKHEKEKEYDLLKRHLNAYVAKNTFDYFIHKDLKGFLYRELDFYIKNEIMHLDDLDTSDEKRVETYLAKVRTVKRIGKIIIDFLAQIENFQKKLWLKKKFIIETNWCITLDNIDESFYPEIAANKSQIQEWIDMYAVDEIETDLTTVGFTNPPTIEFLKQNQHLIVDTKHFDTVFKEKLIASIDDIDKHTDGLIINGDNYHSLSILKEKYAKTIDTIYIDPPYNTDASKILYKNNYEHSSWLCLMKDRIVLGKSLLKDDGLQSVAIDEYELKELYGLLQETFGRLRCAGIVAIRSNPSGRPTDGGFALSHEYALVFKNSENAIVDKVERTEEQNKRYDKNDEQGPYEQRNFRREGSNSDRMDGIRQWYPIYVNKTSLKLRVPKMIWNNDTELWNILEEPTSDEEVVYPVNDDGVEKNWRWAWENVIKDYSQFYAIKQKSGIQVYYKFRPNKTGISPLTFWEDKRYSATENGTKLLKKILPNNPFSYPKSIYAVEDMLRITGMKSKSSIVIDFFAGSGTTGHAVLNLNRSDNGNRKYILVEMGEYFYSVTCPRMKKIIYCTDWKDGKPQNRTTGVSHIMKYMTLESYEDALTNISLSNEKHKMSTLFGDEYMINYMLDIEAEGSLLNMDAFTSPFEYKLKVTENNETKEKNIDVVETFNYLIGLTVKSISATAYFNAKPDPYGEYEGAVRLEKDDYGTYGFKQIEGSSPDGRRVLVIWRTISENLVESNAALDAYFAKHRINPQDREYDIIYVNGDNNLQNLQSDDETWKVQMTEIEFKKRMFEEE